MTNVLFIIVVILQSFPSISTNSPTASLIPLIFVIVAGMVRELLADLKRWKQDKWTNNRVYSKILNRGNATTAVKS